MNSLQFAVCSLQRRATDGSRLAARSWRLAAGGSWLVAALALAIAAAAAPALAQVRSSTNFAVTADGIDSGGGTGASANYAQRGSFGQAFATPPMAGTSYNNFPGLEAAIPAAGFSLTPPSLSFGGQAPGTTSAAQNITLANTGGVVITLSSIAIGGANAAEFGQTNGCGATLAAGASCTVSVTFTPSGMGAKSAALTVTSNAPGSPHAAALSGTGVTAPDTQAPTVPTLLAATAISSSQINLAWNASSDNVGVTAYQVFRGGSFRVTVSGSTSFSDIGLAASTPYSYTVNACDAAGYCSAQSGAVSATTQASDSTYTANLVAGFNLIGNSLNITIDVANTFGNQDLNAQVAGVTPNVVSIWKWNAVDGRWAFYSPQLTLAGNATHAAAHRYELLAVINPGEGYWVNAVGAITLPAQTGTGFAWNGFNFQGLPSGFNLIATADSLTPSQFNTQVSQSPPTASFVSLWAWDAVRTNWYFYSPLLGGLPAVQSYANLRGFLHFEDYNKTLGIGTGFWVNKP